MAGEPGRTKRSRAAPRSFAKSASSGAAPVASIGVTKDWTADLDARNLRTMLGQCWSETKARSASAWLLKAIGWLITALAVSLGGPFWFELLNRLVDMRGAGKKPPSVTTAAAAQR